MLICRWGMVPDHYMCPRGCLVCGQNIHRDNPGAYPDGHYPGCCGQTICANTRISNLEMRMEALKRELARDGSWLYQYTKDGVDQVFPEPVKAVRKELRVEYQTAEEASEVNTATKADPRRTS